MLEGGLTADQPLLQIPEYLQKFGICYYHHPLEWVQKDIKAILPTTPAARSSRQSSFQTVFTTFQIIS